MEGNYLSPIIDAFKPILIFAAVLWGIEIIITMLIKDHKKAKRKQAREKRRLEYQDRRMANDAEHAKVTRAMRYDVLRRDNFHCVRCGRGKEDGVKLHVDHIVPVSRGGKSVMSNLQTLCEDCNYGKGNKYRARSLTNKALETRDSCESLANQRNVVEHDSHEERI